MLGNLIFTLLSAASVGRAVATPLHLVARDDAGAALEDLAKQSYDQVNEQLKTSSTARIASGNQGCSIHNLKVRREWNTLSSRERKEYTSAVKCLMSKPAKTPSEEAPGAKSRFDDFVATHINQTLTIHFTGNFLSWHRYYTWLYEEALREECGYTGTQPYWDWGLTAFTGLENGGMLDGSDTSMSGNGAPIPNQGDVVFSFMGSPPIVFPPGSGGGCVESGPFKDMQVNLGPVQLFIPGNDTIDNSEPLKHNPRCLKRDLTDEINRASNDWASILDLIVRFENVADFQFAMQGTPGGGKTGVHGGGHFTMGGDPGRDIYTSPGDPLFYLHHAQIDRVWWMWQLLDPSTRMQGESAVAGSNTYQNRPPSADTSIEDYVNYGYAAGPPRQIKDLLSTTSGPFCYVYL